MCPDLIEETEGMARGAGMEPELLLGYRFFNEIRDPDASVCKAYGVYKEKNMYGKKSMGIERTTFVIDGDGKIARIYPNVKVGGHVDAILKDLARPTT